MKILLVQSYLGSNDPLVAPLGLLSLVPTLNGHDVHIFDTNCFDSSFTALEKKVTTFCPDVIGISLRNIDSTNKTDIVFYYRFLPEILDVLTQCSQAKIVIGGSGFSMFAEEIMVRETRLDFGVYLEGETVFSELLKNLETPQKVASVY